MSILVVNQSVIDMLASLFVVATYAYSADVTGFGTPVEKLGWGIIIYFDGPRRHTLARNLRRP